MKKIYIAKRIPHNSESKMILSINSKMALEEIHKAYTTKEEILDSYIYNGPWVLRAPVSNDNFSLNQIPRELKPIHVWNMVKEKINSSDVMLGIVNSKSYGTIAEIGYACNCLNIAIYVLPDVNIQEEELQDLWFIFQMIQTTKKMWHEDDIKLFPEFLNYNIHSLAEYEIFIQKIIPNFMKK